MEIKEYEEKYAKEISEIVLNNLYKINIKDYGKELIDKIAVNFSEEMIKNNFSKRVKCFVAINDEKVVGTASIDLVKEKNNLNINNKNKDKYIILTVFTKIENHHQGIGKMLIEKVEEYAKQVGAKELIIPASVYGCDFYKKMGYDYYQGITTNNKNGEYILSKILK